MSAVTALGALADNVRGGMHLALALRASPERFHASLDQVVLLSVLTLASGFAWEWLLTEPPRELEPTGLAVQLAWLMLTLGLAVLASRERRGGARPALTAVMLLSPLATGWLGFACLELGVRYWPAFADLSNDLYWPLIFAVWLCPVYARVIRIATQIPTRRACALAVVYSIVVFRAFEAWPSAFLVFTAGPSDHQTETLEPEAEPIDAEEVLHAQRTRVQQRVQALAEQRPGVVDLYFVGFAADGSQSVFRREIEYVRELFDRRFDTEGRSLALINHPETIDAVPLASASNLRDALEGIAHKMDPEEDVLFLYLTGHGSRSHRLVVTLADLPLNDLEPESLGQMLHDAGVRWRVIGISACYSGGYVEPLRDDHSVVMTAAAADRTSFGCSEDADLTYFARAYFEQGLELEYDFVSAFEGARARVTVREAEEERTPSRPQIAVGNAMPEKLATLVHRLDSR